MNLYLDLKKAVQIPNTATDSKPGRQVAREYNESFDKVSGGVADEPDDKVRSDTPDNTGALDDQLEDDRKLDTQIAQERGIVGKPDTKKSNEAVEMLKSLTNHLREQMAPVLPNEAEIRYLTTQCYRPEPNDDGVRELYTREDVLKGYATITGSERNRFNNWLQDEFRKSLRGLVR